MVYMGSKAKYAEHIVPILQKCINDKRITTYIECFCGGCNIIDKINCENKYAYDRSDTLIALLQTAQEDMNKVLEDGTRELWDKGKGYIKDGIMPSDMTLAEIGAMEFFASFNNGGFPRGYAKNTPKRNYFKEARRNLEIQAPNLKGIIFGCQNYWELDKDIKNAVIYCFDKETEILTKDGWKLLKDVDINQDTFLSREPGTKQLDYLRADYYTHYHYTGKMCHYTGRQLDFCVTPDHKIFCAKKTGRKREKIEQFITAQEFSEKNTDWVFVKGGAVWNGTNQEMFDLCGQPVDFVKFSRLLGIFLTDGSVNNQGIITITQSKDNIIKIIRKLLIDLKLSYTEHEYTKGVTTFYISQIYKDFFLQFYDKQKRKIPDTFKNASVVAISELIEGILDGDSDSERRKIWLSSKTLVDDIQECLFKIGKSSNYSISPPKASYLANENRIIQGTLNQYTVSILETENPTYYKNNIKWEDYDDEVYCVTLEKWHTVLVRRNGKTIWLGQCDPPYEGTKIYGYSNQPLMDYTHFWNWVRDISKNNYVFVSEQKAPEDFISIWTQNVKRTNNSTNDYQAVENLFQYKEGLK